MTQKKINNGLISSTTVQEIQQIQDAFDSLIKDSSSSLSQVFEIFKSYSSKMKELNPYKELIEQQKSEKEQMSVELDYYEDAMNKRLAVDRWYAQEKEKLQKNQVGLSAIDINNANTSLNELYQQRSFEAEQEVWEERGEKIAKVFESNFDDILKNYDHFGDELKNVAQELTSALIKEAAQAGIQSIFKTGKVQNILGAISNASNQGGFIGVGASFIKGIGKAFGIFHSGGIVPVGANSEIPGTNEQLALLKGGERILSPSENTNYKDTLSGGGGSSPVVFNNFNVKAWDSKDVSKYLLENQDLINRITFDGIKYNNCNLRNMVRGA